MESVSESNSREVVSAQQQSTGNTKLDGFRLLCCLLYGSFIYKRDNAPITSYLPYVSRFIAFIIDEYFASCFFDMFDNKPLRIYNRFAQIWCHLTTNSILYCIIYFVVFASSIFSLPTPIVIVTAGNLFNHFQYDFKMAKNGFISIQVHVFGPSTFVIRDSSFDSVSCRLTPLTWSLGLSVPSNFRCLTSTSSF